MSTSTLFPGRYVEARRTWACQCPCGCVHLIPACDKYWRDQATGKRMCVTCSHESRCLGLRVDWPDHGFVGCCFFCDPTTEDFDCTTADGGACCGSCDFRGGGCLVECICGQPICTTALAPHGSIRWDDRDAHTECYQTAVLYDLMTPGGDHG